MDLKITDEQHIKIFDKFRKEFTCVADDKQLKEWGNSDEEIKRIKIRDSKSIIKLREDGIRLKMFIDTLTTE